MQINREFSPITIKLETKADLDKFKTLAHVAVSSNESSYWIFKSSKLGNPDWMNLAREILDL